jgi:hypothetical protein
MTTGQFFDFSLVPASCDRLRILSTNAYCCRSNATAELKSSVARQALRVIEPLAVTAEALQGDGRARGRGMATMRIS